eukprot:7532910-Karenia_brevis.AAC.1
MMMTSFLDLLRGSYKSGGRGVAESLVTILKLIFVITVRAQRRDRCHRCAYGVYPCGGASLSYMILPLLRGLKS